MSKTRGCKNGQEKIKKHMTNVSVHFNKATF